MSVEKLIQTLLKEGRLTDQAVTEEAKSEIDKIRQETEMRLNELDEMIELSNLSSAKKESKLKLSYERMSLRNNQLLREVSAIKVVRTALLKRFNDYMKSDDYQKYIEKTFESVKDELGENFCLAADSITAKAFGDIGKVDTQDNVGFAAKSSDGKKAFYFTVESFIDSTMRGMEPEIISLVKKNGD